MYFNNKYIIIKNNMNNINNIKNIENNIQKERKNKLIFEFNENKIKLPDKYFGDTYSYINYGKPSIEYIVHNELNKISLKRRKRIKLNNELKKKNIPLDESLESCYNYINTNNSKSLNDTVRAIEIEYFFKYQTNFTKYIKLYNLNESKNRAMLEYIENNNSNKNILKFIKNGKKIKLCFD